MENIDKNDELIDVVIIGSGVCGALAAQRLAQRGLRIIMLEAGEHGPSRHELVANYVTASKKTMGSPYKSDGNKIVPSPDGGDDPYYDQSSPAFKATYQRRIGGSTWHWRGNVPRFVPNDFRLFSTYGVGVDWPLSYSDLESFYCEAESELGVSGNHEEWQNFKGAFRSKAFPMSEIWESFSDTVVANKINNLDIYSSRIKVMRTPQARNSQPYDGRPVCAGNSTCDPICPIAAKYDGTVHVKKALTAGVILREKSVATKLIVGNDNRIERVEYIDWNGSKFNIRAKVVVVAAHAIETPKLLLLSVGLNTPHGVSNSSGFVGRCLMDHLQGQAAAQLNFPVFPFRGPITTSGIDVFRDGLFRKEHSAFRMSLGNDGWGLVEGPYATLMNIIRTPDQFIFGEKLPQLLRERLCNQFRISYSTETLPDPTNKIFPSPDQRDVLGIPKPKIEFRPSPYQLKAFEAARVVIRQIFNNLNAVETKFASDPNSYSSANHIMGTCKMGTDPKNSVVSPECRSHDHKNLFIIGASVFPTCGTANPTLTAVAPMLDLLTILV